jgi:hypothetical protein
MTIIIYIHADCGGVIQNVVMSTWPTVVHERCTKCGTLFYVHKDDDIDFKEIL